MYANWDIISEDHRDLVRKILDDLYVDGYSGLFWIDLASQTGGAVATDEQIDRAYRYAQMCRFNDQNPDW